VRDFKKRLVKAFWQLAQQHPTASPLGTLVPNFLDPVAVARAWADEYEARQAAEQELARQRIPTQPSQPFLPEIPFISAWWHCVGNRDVTAGDLYQIISGQQCPLLTQAATELFGAPTSWTARKLTTALKTGLVQSEY
jgi:hypothetical protein